MIDRLENDVHNSREENSLGYYTIPKVHFCIFPINTSRVLPSILIKDQIRKIHWRKERLFLFHSCLHIHDIHRISYGIFSPVSFQKIVYALLANAGFWKEKEWGTGN